MFAYDMNIIVKFSVVMKWISHIPIMEELYRMGFNFDTKGQNWILSFQY